MIVKIWNIKGGSGSNGSKGLSQSLNYITSKEKTYDTVDEEYQKTSDISRALEYMSNEYKIEQKYISGYLCDPEFAVEQFNMVRDRNLARLGKTEDEGNIAYHLIQSFPVDLDISNEEVHQCGLELAKKIGLHQAVICSHVHPVKDKDGNITGLQKHNHILINAHTTDPEKQYGSIKRMKYNDCRESYALLQKWNDEIAIAHDLPIIDNPDVNKKRSWSEYDAIRKNQSWKQKIREDIEEVKASVDTWEDYIEKMQEKGYEINEGKYVSYKAEGQERSVRDKTLGIPYTKTGIEEYWLEKKEIEEFLNKEMRLNDNNTYRITVNNSMMQPGDNGIYINLPGSDKKIFLTNEDYQRIDANSIEIYISDKKAYPEGKNLLSGMAVLKSFATLDDRDKMEAEYEYISKGIEMRTTTVKDVEVKEDGKIYLKLPNSNKNILLEKDDYKQLSDRSYQIYIYSNKQYEVDGKLVDGKDLLKYLSKNKEYEESRTYFNPRYINSKNKKPYRIGLYTNTGRKRTFIELVILLAMTVVKYEGNINPNFSSSQVDSKIQSMMDAVKISREENITSPEDIKAKLNEVGIEISKLKTQTKRNDTTLNKMEVINKAVEQYEEVKDVCDAIYSMPEGEEKDKALRDNRDIIQQYSLSKAVLYKYKVIDDIDGFKERYIEKLALAKELSNRLDDASEEYRRLKKVQYTFAAAQDYDYVYNREPEKEIERNIEREQEKEQDREKDKKI